MQVEAIYEHGSLKLLQPLRLKKGCERLTVTVPDDALESLPEDDKQLQTSSPAMAAAHREHANAMLARLDTVREAALSCADEDDALTGKARERLEVFELRAQHRRQQGRAV